MPKFQVYYARRPSFQPGGEFGTPHLTLTGLQASHVYLCTVEANCLDDAYCRMQGESWSPRGEARDLLRRLGLSHTSLSVGDVIKDEEGVYWECLDRGWRSLEDDAQGDRCHVPE